MPDLRLYPSCMSPEKRSQGMLHDIQDPELHLAASVNDVRFEGETVAVHAVIAYMCPLCGEPEEKAVPEKTVDMIETRDVSIQVSYDVDELTQSLQQ